MRTTRTMRTMRTTRTISRLRTTGNDRPIAKKAIMIGVAGGLAAIAWLAIGRDRRRSRRYADRAPDRRNPLHFFLAGAYPRRRTIDVSGRRPLFERRQSVYDRY
jgi:hypothetical protein